MRQHSALQLRRGNLADFRASQMVLSQGEPCFIIDYNTLVVGDGVSTVDELHPSPTETVKISVKNTSGNTITQATPVYITGVVGSTDTLRVAPADASDVLKMPSIGILEEDLENDAFGHAIVGGILKHVKGTDQIDGNPNTGSVLYVKAGGGLTTTKPTGASNLIQNVGKIGKVSSGNSGSIIVSSIMRTNDVPNAVSCETMTIGDYRLQEESGRLILLNINTGQKYNFTLTEINPSTAWSPSDLGSALALWLDASDSSTVVLNGTFNVSRWDDKSGNDYHAIQPNESGDDQPIYPAEQNRIIFNASDRLLTTLPATTGTLVLGTTNGTAAYSVNISAGSYDIGRRGGNYMPDGTAYGYILSNTEMSQNEIEDAIAYLRSKGAGQNYASVTNFANYWRDWSELTTFPLIDTSSATAFESAWDSCSSLTSFPIINTSSAVSLQTAWRGCSSLVSFPLINTGSVVDFSAAWIGCSGLTSFPAINTSSGTNLFAAWQSCSSLTSFPLLNTTSATNFQQSWQFCSSLTSFPANFFDNCSATNFNNAFRNTNLSQESIDNILVSIESNGASNGTFTQSGGSAPSATGEAAITALRNRGWTVTVTGGF